MLSDTEGKRLVEERTRLEDNIDTLQGRIGELHLDLDDEHGESVRKEAQYVQILAMSSRLQAQTAVDVTTWEAETNPWAQVELQLTGEVDALRRSEARIPNAKAGPENLLCGFIGRLTSQEESQHQAREPLFNPLPVMLLNEFLSGIFLNWTTLCKV